MEKRVPSSERRRPPHGARRTILTISLALCTALGGMPAASAGTPKVLRPDLTYLGVTAGDAAGFQVQKGDFDGDGIDDLLVGAWLEDGGGNDAGAVYIMYGPLKRKKTLAQADAKLMGPLAGDYVGEGPLGVADVNGDGADDIVIGAPGSFFALQPGSPGKIGETYLIYGGKKRLRGERSLPDVADAVFTGLHMTEWLGFGSGGVGDLDGDGYEDFLIGAPATLGFSGVGYLFYGSKKKFKGTVPVTNADAILIGGKPGEMFGYESVGGDIDGDGFSDLLVNSLPLAGQPGTLHVFYGGQRMSGLIASEAADSRILFPSVDIFAGISMDASGDLTGDGISDIAIGDGSRVNQGSSYHGYIVAGGARLPRRALIGQVAHASISGPGASVTVADVNGDRRADVIFGTPHLPDGHGAVVFYGPIAPAGLTEDEIDRTLQGEPATRAGHAVTAGRFGRNRFDGVAVGAPAGAGRVHVYLGRKGR